MYIRTSVQQDPTSVHLGSFPSAKNLWNLKSTECTSCTFSRCVHTLTERLRKEPVIMITRSVFLTVYIFIWFLSRYVLMRTFINMECNICSRLCHCIMCSSKSSTITWTLGSTVYFQKRIRFLRVYICLEFCVKHPAMRQI